MYIKVSIPERNMKQKMETKIYPKNKIWNIWGASFFMA